MERGCIGKFIFFSMEFVSPFEHCNEYFLHRVSSIFFNITIFYYDRVDTSEYTYERDVTFDVATTRGSKGKISNAKLRKLISMGHEKPTEKIIIGNEGPFHDRAGQITK